MDYSGAIILAFFLGIIPAVIAGRKGRNFALWYTYGFLFFLIAFIHSLVLAPRRRCPYCQEGIQPTAIVCPHCRRDLPESESPDASEGPSAPATSAALLDDLHDPDWRTREFAIVALAQSEDDSPEIDEALQAMLEDKRRSVRARAKWALEVRKKDRV